MKLHLDPRTKLFLILLCVLSAVFAPNLYFQFALVTLISLYVGFRLWGIAGMMLAPLLVITVISGFSSLKPAE